MRGLMLVCTIGLLGSVPMVAAAQSSGTYEDVPREAVRCIVDNVSTYMALGKPLVIIRPELCPETDVLKDAGEGANNMVGESFYKDEKGQRRRVATVVYTARHLKCLSERAQSASIERLPKNPCE